MGSRRNIGLKDYLDSMAQDRDEIAALSKMLSDIGATSLLEIGSRFGGSLWYLANFFPLGSRIVSVDSGIGIGGSNPGQVTALRDCVNELSMLGYDAHFLHGNSAHPKIVAAVRALGPYDAVFIDGDHTYAGVESDWRTYGAMATRIVALHDVSFEWNSDMKYPRDMIGVPRLWKKITVGHNTEVFSTEGSNKGIGVVRK